MINLIERGERSKRKMGRGNPYGVVSAHGIASVPCGLLSIFKQEVIFNGRGKTAGFYRDCRQLKGQRPGSKPDPFPARKPDPWPDRHSEP